MSEEEIIDIVQNYINYIRTGENPRYGINKWQLGIENLLDLYKQEKEKNKELEEKLKIATAMLTKGTYPEKNECDNDFDKQFIAVDKIKDKIEDYEKMIEGTFKDITWLGQNRRNNCYEIIKVLEELLEEK